METSKQEGISDNRQVPELPELPDLVWHLILQLLSETSHSTVCSVAATSRRLYMLAVPVLYQKINLAYGNRDPGLFQRLAKTGTGLTKFIQEIKIRYGQGIDDTTLQQLAKIFSTATQLRTLTWSGNYSIHDEILQNLHRSSPHARIIVEGEIPHRIEPSEPEQEQRIGVSSPNLYSLYATISAEPHAAQAAKLSVYHTLRSSPNIRKLEMYQQSGGCVRYGYQPELNVEFDVREGEQLPQLEELAFPMFSSRDMVRWGDMGGFSRLKVLKLSGYSTGIGAFVGRTPCLRSLTLDLPWEDIKASEQYLVQITGLEELVLSGYGMEFPFGLLEKNSDSLTALTVHAPEPCDPHRRPDVQLSVLQKLRETCPNLTFLAVDINREGEWPYDYLAELSKFPHLTHLKLMAEGTRGTGEPVLPLLDIESGKSLFSYLLAHKTSPASRLKRLTIERGGMGSWQGGLPGPGVMEEGNYHRTFEYALNDSDGTKKIRAKESESIASRFWRWKRRTSENIDDIPLLGALATEEVRLLARWLESGEEIQLTELYCEVQEDQMREVLRDAQPTDLVCDLKEDQMRGMLREECKELTESFASLNEEQRKDFAEKLREGAEKRIRVRAMEKAFTKECTLYDILKAR